MPGDAAVDRRDLFGHPAGLAALAITELWERFAFFGMQALLVLYMVGHLLLPPTIGHVWGFAAFRHGVEGVFGTLSTQALATQIFGLYVGAANFLPLLGSAIGDRIGRRPSVTAGLVLLAAGHFAMGVEAAFLPALLLIVTGCGLLKGNLAAQVGALYADGDQRRDSGFTIYIWVVNLGGLLAPLVCGTLGEVYGWGYGFAAAGGGMVLALGVYLSASSLLPDDAPRTTRERIALTTTEVSSIVALLVVLGVAVLFWAAQVQVWNTYPLWVKARVALDLGGMALPVTWFQSLDAGGLLVLTPIVLWSWRQQRERGREPVAVDKLIIGCAIFAAGFVWLAGADALAGTGKINVLLPTVYHFIAGLGFLFFVPVALSIVSRAAPPSTTGLMIAIFYCSLSVGSVASGALGRLYEQMSPPLFWLLHAAIVGAGSLILLILRGPLARALRES